MVPNRTYAALGMGGLKTENPDLDSYAAGWMIGEQAKFIAPMGCSQINSDSADGSYPIWDLENLLAMRAGKISPGAPADDGKLKLSRQSFLCEPYSYEVPVADLVVAQAAGTALDVQMTATEAVTRAAGAEMEQVYHDTVFNTASWAANVAGVATGPTAAASFDPYSGTAGDRNILRLSAPDSNPVQDFRRMRLAMEEQTGYTPTHAIFGAKAYEDLVEHPAVIARMNRGQTNGPAMANREDLQNLFEIPNVLPMRSLSAKGSFFNDDSVWVGYVNAMPGTSGVTSVACMSWNRFAPGAQIVIDSYYDQRRRSLMMRSTMAFDIHVVSRDLGILVSSYR